MPLDAWECVAASLRGDEATMLRELLASAGIDAIVEGGVSAGPFPVPSFGVSSVLVPVADAARAREIVATSGFAPGAGDARGEGEEIPEEEWRAPPVPEPPREEREAEMEASAALTLRFLENVAAVVLLAAAVVLALFGRFSTALPVAILIVGRLVMRRGSPAGSSERGGTAPPEGPPAPRRMLR